MASVTLWGDTYSNVTSVSLPKTGGGTAQFIDAADIRHYYTGSSAPTAALGEDGDIYLQTGG